MRAQDLRHHGDREGPGGQVAYSNGTGLLVAPDLVLTARHVLKFHILNGQQRNPSPRAFDQVNSAAQQYYESRLSTPIGHAEWLYHRLLGGEHPDSVDRERWRRCWRAQPKTSRPTTRRAPICSAALPIPTCLPN